MNSQSHCNNKKWGWGVYGQGRGGGGIFNFLKKVSVTIYNFRIAPMPRTLPRSSADCRRCRCDLVKNYPHLSARSHRVARTPSDSKNATWHRSHLTHADTPHVPDPDFANRQANIICSIYLLFGVILADAVTRGRKST